MDTGIYCIENTINGKKYIGKTSESFERRWYIHAWNLNKGSHSNRHLQNAWKKYGEENFKFYILMELPAIDFILNIAENIFIIKFSSHESLGGYNLTMGGEGSSGWTPSEETREKISKANKGYKFSEERKQKHSKRMKENPPMLGKHLSPESKERIQLSLIGRKHSAETKEKLSISHKGLLAGDKNPNFGRKRSEEEKRSVSEKLHREKHPNFGKKRKGSSSKYYGVIYDKRWGGKWLAKFTLDGEKVYIGSFKLEIDAAKAYDQYVINNNLNNPLNFPEDYNKGRY